LAQLKKPFSAMMELFTTPSDGETAYGSIDCPLGAGATGVVR